jgi:antibiotic biosynthesis monooxygenase (ABM) superfamily enzyme
MPFWLALFLGNAVVTGLLGWYFVPWASRALHWWLNPTPAAARRVNWGGTVLIMVLYGLCLLVFSQFPP